MADTIFNIISICGSLRKGSYNRMVMNALPGLAPPALSFTEAPPFFDFPLYNADVETSTGFPAAVQKLAEAVRAADGVDHRHAGIQLLHSRRVKERNRLGVARAQPTVHRQAGRDPVGVGRTARRRPHAI